MANTSEQDESESHARRASSFGAEAAEYAEHRPDYPIAAIRWALEALDGKPNPAVVDLGAGTGKLTAGLREAGAVVTAVEPDAGMLAEFQRLYPEVTGLAGAAEAIPLPDDSMDAVVVGQALHWFDAARAYPEIARVLRPGGVLAALWNTYDTRVDWVAEVSRLSESAPLSERSPEENLPSHPLFEPFQLDYFSHAHRRTVEGLVATLSTHSKLLVASPEERAEVQDRVTGYLRSRPETNAGEFDVPMRTLVIRTVLR